MMTSRVRAMATTALSFPRRRTSRRYRSLGGTSQRKEPDVTDMEVRQRAMA
jgi:hypothetical protein